MVRLTNARMMQRGKREKLRRGVRVVRVVRGENAQMLKDWIGRLSHYLQGF